MFASAGRTTQQQRQRRQRLTQARSMFDGATQDVNLYDSEEMPKSQR
jgi:hypothetical protein